MRSRRDFMQDAGIVVGSILAFGSRSETEQPPESSGVELEDEDGDEDDKVIIGLCKADNWNGADGAAAQSFGKSIPTPNGVAEERVPMTVTDHDGIGWRISFPPVHFPLFGKQGLIDAWYVANDDGLLFIDYLDRSYDVNLIDDLYLEDVEVELR